MGCKDRTVGHPRIILPAVHRNVVQKNGKVYETRGELLERGNYVNGY